MESPFLARIRAAADGAASSSTPVDDGNQPTQREHELIAYMQQQMQQQLQLQQQHTAQQIHQLQQQLSAERQASPPPGAADAAGLAASIGSAIAAASTLQPLPTFDGAGSTAGIAAHSCLQRVELAFEARSQAVAGAPLSDAQKISSAASALSGSAHTWYATLPARPQEWASFRTQLLAHFQPASALRIIESRLHALAAATAKISERGSTQQLQQYTAQFTLLANQIPLKMMAERARVMLYASGLPQRLRKTVLEDDDSALAADRTLALQDIVNKILKRSATHEMSYQPASGAPRPSADAMDVSALIAEQFGLSRAAADAVLEGLPEYDTDSPAARPASSLQQQVHELTTQLAAMSSGRGQRPARSSKLEGIPQKLLDDRYAAGLCKHCGEQFFENGKGLRGHHAGNCGRGANKSLSAKEGLERARKAQPDFRTARS